MKIDAEMYFWKYAKTFRHPLIRGNELLQREYLPGQIQQTLHRNGLDGCIGAVAEDAEVETRFLTELALTHSYISGVIGWIDLYDFKAAEKIQEFQQYPIIRGYRIETRKDQFPSADVMKKLLECQYSLDLSPGSETDPDDLGKWLGANPEQHFILSNCANPDAKQAPTKVWETTIRELSKNHNLSCKLSGLFIRGNRKSWKPADFYPFLEILFESFGHERLLFASDWPFMLLAGIYVQWKSLLQKFTENFSPADGDKFFGENAQRIYRL